MNRRGFLQWTLGACALTAAQRAGVAEALEALPLEPVFEEEVIPLHWAEPVDKVTALPARGKVEGEARWIISTDEAYIWIGDKVGWVVMSGPGC